MHGVGPAHLDMEAADRRQVEHGVEGRDLVGADVGHAEKSGDIFDHRDRQPALGPRLGADLALGDVEQGMTCALLASRRVAADDQLRELVILRGERESAPAARISGLAGRRAASAIRSSRAFRG
jgi:hypothetical protein